jgi:hypothetical protein
MAKLVAGTFFLFAAIFIGQYMIKVMLSDAKKNWALVIGTIVTCMGSLFGGGLLIAEGGIDYVIDYGLPLRYETYQPTELPLFAQNEFISPLTPEEEALAACNVSLDYYKTLVDANLTFTHERNNDLEQCQNTLIEWALTCEVP